MKFKKRTLSQLIFTILANANIAFLWQKALYRGPFKGLCFPGLNCYSCPAALFACPLGALQQSLLSLRLLKAQALASLSYVLGFLFLYGIFLGRVVCGWICPFGFLQELIFRIKTSKLEIPRKLYLVKYVLLAIFVILLPAIMVTQTGYGKPWFCNLICPAGTLEAGLINLSLRDSLRALVGFLFYWKVMLLLAIMVLCVFYFRFFCAVLCPLGALYGLFNRLSLIKLTWRKEDCLDCHLCEKICPLNLKVPEELNGPECIRCLNCLNICPTRVIQLELSLEMAEKFDEKNLAVKKETCAQMEENQTN